MCNVQLVSHCFPLMDPAVIPCCDTSTVRNGHGPDDTGADQPLRTETIPGMKKADDAA